MTATNKERLSAGDSTVRGLVVNGFNGADIRIQGGGNNLIAGNYLGTDVTGTQAVPGARNVANIGLSPIGRTTGR